MYSFIDPALGIIVASSAKLIDWRNMATSATARASRKTQLAKKPETTVARTVDATISPKVVPIAVGSPTAGARGRLHQSQNRSPSRPPSCSTPDRYAIFTDRGLR